jgi:hypothetical protein
MKSITRTLALGLLFATAIFMTANWLWAENPASVGKVKWGRDLDQALSQSKSSGKPVLTLFQEVPGCSGCQAFGQEVLSEPGIVKAIQDNFVPLLIHNNGSGKDAEVLKRFNEPAWNFQVIRFLDAAGNDLIPRKDHVWTAPELQERMAAALEKAGRRVPTELRRSPVPNGGTAAAEGPAPTEKIALGQYCFWTGEMKLGALHGVVRTEAGHFDGSEVTLVEFDPHQISLEKLLTEARRAGVADAVYPAKEEQMPAIRQAGFAAGPKLDSHYTAAPASDQKKQIQGTSFARLELTPEQATKVNAFARSAPKEALKYLTAPQRAALER